ncbi:MAG: hypothetical protein FJZ16_06160 [Candidatus Omnitrophica bacterium]|nr:hypothetical protein [Candidatus Omnitrophota bacterium]
MTSKLKMLNPINILQQYRQRIGELTRNIITHINHLLQIKENGFKTVISKLEALSPLSILSRGYSITFLYPDSGIIRESSVAKKGVKIKTKLFKGSLISTVEEIYE